MTNKIKATKSNPDRSPIGGAAAPPYQGKPDEFKLIARAELFPDPDQPRKTFEQNSLEDLADSIREQGIVQPLIVRLVKAVLRIREPDLHNAEYRLENQELPDDSKAFPDEVALHEFLERQPALEPLLKDRYVIVAGERRWRASELAGLNELPCIVRDVDGHRVFAQQFIENEQRVNISAIEEAEALTKQLEKRKAESGNFSVEDLAKEIGMSRAGLYQRLALTRLHAPVREALLAGKISTSVAGVVAIVPLPAQQEKLLKEITNEQHWKFPFSVRDVQDMVDEEYCKQLSSAPFDQHKNYYDVIWEADKTSITPAPQCSVCPHRTGNMTDQFPELAKRPNVCTRPDCFAAKCKAHWLAKSQDLAQKGATVLTEKELKKVAADYVRADSPDTRHYGLFPEHWAEAPEKVLGKHAPEPVYVSTTDGLKKYFKRADIPEAAKKAKVKLANDKPVQAETPEQKAKREAKEQEQAALRSRQEEFVKSQFPALGKALEKLKAGVAWDLALTLIKQADGYYDGEAEAAIIGKSKSAQVKVLARFYAELYREAVNRDGWDKEGCSYWKLVGIDLVKEFEASEKAAQAALALPAKKAVAQGKLLDVPKKKKK
jgi:ParB/RepB/Spo0J family partition protein